jgi:hypothetical protein
MSLRNPEDRLQEAVCIYLKAQYPQTVFYSIPNGSNKTRHEQHLFKATGLTPGVPDLCIAKPAYGFGGKTLYHGLYIELKTPKGRLSPAQKEMILRLETNGYLVEVCRSLDEAMAVIDKYLT